MTDDVKALRKENLELKQRADLLEKENRALKVQLDRMQEDLALLAAWMRDPKEAINLARRQRDYYRDRAIINEQTAPKHLPLPVVNFEGNYEDWKENNPNVVSYDTDAVFYVEAVIVAQQGTNLTISHTAPIQFVGTAAELRDELAEMVHAAAAARAPMRHEIKQWGLMANVSLDVLYEACLNIAPAWRYEPKPDEQRQLDRVIANAFNRAIMPQFNPLDRDEARRDFTRMLRETFDGIAERRGVGAIRRRKPGRPPTK